MSPLVVDRATKAGGRDWAWERPDSHDGEGEGMGGVGLQGEEEQEDRPSAMTCGLGGAQKQ